MKQRYSSPLFLMKRDDMQSNGKEEQWEELDRDEGQEYFFHYFHKIFSSKFNISIGNI